MVQMSLHDPQRSVLTAVIQSLLVDGEFINDGELQDEVEPEGENEIMKGLGNGKIMKSGKSGGI